MHTEWDVLSLNRSEQAETETFDLSRDSSVHEVNVLPRIEDMIQDSYVVYSFPEDVLGLTKGVVLEREAVDSLYEKKGR